MDMSQKNKEEVDYSLCFSASCACKMALVGEPGVDLDMLMCETAEGDNDFA